MTRPVVLTFIGNYLPGYKAGGPIRSISNMVEQLGDAFEFRIVTADRDLGDREPYAGLAVDEWIDCGRAKVFYRSPNARGHRALRASLPHVGVDLIYLNSLFNVRSTLSTLLDRRLGLLPVSPVLLAPRGELSSGALSTKPFKKRVFLEVARLFSLYRDVTFHASSEHEARDIRAAFPANPIAVASAIGQGSSGRPHQARQRPTDARDGELAIVLLSRVSPMKNLIGALEMLARVSGPVQFDIYGVMEDEAYWVACQAAIAALPPHVRVTYRGPVRPDAVSATLAPYDLFFLPTLGENYGHVIREALSAGLPVLISDRTPWRDLHAKGVGIDLPLEQPDAFVTWIEHFRSLDPDARARMRQAAREMGDDPAVAEESREANRKMLHAALHPAT